MDLKYLKSVFFYLCSALISVGIIIYILYHLLGGFQIETETIVSELVTRTEKITLNAYVFRSETVLYSSAGGTVNYLCDDGEKISNATEVANIYSSGEEEIRSQLVALDQKIDILRSSNPGDSRTVTDRSLLDKQIAQLYYAIRTSTDEGDIGYAAQKKAELLVLLNRRNLIVHSVTDYDSQIAQYEAQREAITSELKTISETITATHSGYFYSAVDGYEKIFDSAFVTDLTLSQFEKMKASDPETLTGTRLAVGKVVTDYVWYIGCDIEAEQTRFFQSGDTYPVIFPYSSDTTVNMKLERIITSNDSDKAVLIFKTGSIPENFNYLRMQQVDVVRKTYTGFGVPVSAVRVVDGEEGVYILNGNVVEFKRIRTLFEENSYFIVEEPDPRADDYAGRLKINDMIIVKGKDLYDGKIIG